jgi:hypothetical protein
MYTYYTYYICIYTAGPGSVLPCPQCPAFQRRLNAASCLVRLAHGGRLHAPPYEARLMSRIELAACRTRRVTRCMSHAGTQLASCYGHAARLMLWARSSPHAMGTQLASCYGHAARLMLWTRSSPHAVDTQLASCYGHAARLMLWTRSSPHAMGTQLASCCGHTHSRLASRVKRCSMV